MSIHGRFNNCGSQQREGDHMMNTIKGMRKSFTLWFNGLLLSASPFLFDGLAYAAAELPKLQEYMPENHYKTMMLLVVGGNIALRFKTTKALAEK